VKRAGEGGRRRCERQTQRVERTEDGGRDEMGDERGGSGVGGGGVDA
jgi:hypothetical protein